MTYRRQPLNPEAELDRAMTVGHASTTRLRRNLAGRQHAQELLSRLH